MHASTLIGRVLCPAVVPFAQRVSAGFILQQDNARP